MPNKPKIGVAGSPEAAAAMLADALGLRPGDSVRIVGSPHERPPSAPSPGRWMPAPGEWEALRQKPMADLAALGFGNWDGGLALIPGEWHGRLPPGLALECIDGEKVVVGRDYIDDDIRFGCLAYGIRVGSSAGGDDAE